MEPNRTVDPIRQEMRRHRTKLATHPGGTLHDAGLAERPGAVRLDPHEEALRGGTVPVRGFWARLRAFAW